MPEIPNKANMPPLVGDPNNEPDPKHPRRIIDPAARIGYERHRFPLPKITGGGKTFIWPVGIESFVRSGDATLGIHKYLGSHYVDVHQVHMDEARIEMSGVFPGLTSTKNMRDLIEVLVARGSKQLYLPGVFTAIQTVFCENYSCDHTEDDRTHSVNYRCSFIRTTTTGKINVRNIATEQAGATIPPGPPQGSVDTKSMNVVQATDGMTTFRTISDYVYDDPDKWQSLVSINQESFTTFNEESERVELMPPYLVVISRLDMGTEVKY